jgi:hypothetical protein
MQPFQLYGWRSHKAEILACYVVEYADGMLSLAIVMEGLVCRAESLLFSDTAPATHWHLLAISWIWPFAIRYPSHSVGDVQNALRRCTEPHMQDVSRSGKPMKGWLNLAN